MMLLGATTRTAFLFAELVWDLRLTTLTLVGVLLLGAMAVALMSRWRRRNRSDELSPSEQLAEYRSLYREGAISKEEFELLRNVLGGELRRKLDVPKPNNTAVQPKNSLPDRKPPEPPADGIHSGGK